MDAAGAVARYSEISPRLPVASFPKHSEHVSHLGELTNEIDLFVLDGFGVLNVGLTAIDGAAMRVAELKQAGKRVMVLTNGASVDSHTSYQKYCQWGFQFAPDDVISSRDGLVRAMRQHPGSTCWGIAAADYSQIDQLAANVVRLEDDVSAYEKVDAFILLSSAQWTAEHQQRLLNAMRVRHRPVLVGNPDLVAPREIGLSLEPGYYAHALADACGCQPHFYGKPFADVFDLVMQRARGIPRHRIAMVGDTLHTDILGGAAAGWRTVLVTSHGLMKSLDVANTIKSTKITPDFIAYTT